MNFFKPKTNSPLILLCPFISALSVGNVGTVFEGSPIEVSSRSPGGLGEVAWSLGLNPCGQIAWWPPESSLLLS